MVAPCGKRINDEFPDHQRRCCRVRARHASLAAAALYEPLARRRELRDTSAPGR